MEKPQIPVAILVRVSTAKQETARQISELRQYADGKGYEVLEVCQERISGGAEDHERDGLRRAEQLARDGKIKKNGSANTPVRPIPANEGPILALVRRPNQSLKP